jgi:hypothetical protein
MSTDTVTAKFPKGVPMSIEDVAAVVGDEFQKMNEDPPPSVVKVREEMEGKSASTRDRLTWAKAAEATPGGLYGYPKGIQRSAESASRKLARTALRVAKRAFAKDENVVAFLQTHVKRENSKSARVLLAAMKEIGPKLASEMKGGRGKEAGAPDYGLYGFRSKTADLGLDSCKEVRTAAGRITADIHRRKADLHDKLTGFWKEHSKQAKCAYAGMLLSCYPDAGMKYATRNITGSVLPNTNTFVHTSKDLRAESGLILDAQILPSELAAFRAHVATTFGRDIPLSVGTFKEAHVSSFVNEDGRTRDVEGTVVITALDEGKVMATTELGFTGLYEPGPMMTVLASGDYIEWEE